MRSPRSLSVAYLFRPAPARWIVCGLAALALAGLYAATLQTHISGSFGETSARNILYNEYIKDVAEIQVALNIWGTIHHTGYPLFAILGNLFTLPLRALGVEPAAAASLYAAAWGAVLLGGFALLVWRLTGRATLAAVSAALLGTARSIWLHHVIAEVYSMSLAITVLLLLVALWPAPWAGAWSARRRLLWLALLGGIGVAHHRAVAFVAPGLFLAIGPALWRERPPWRRTALQAVGLAALGFLPYLYLPLRARQDGSWVYGEPGTLRGLWVEFSGKEADRLVKLPADVSGLADNLASVWRILLHELSLPGLLIGLACLLLAITVAPQRRAARVVALSAAGPTLFAVFFHTAVLPQAVLMPTTLALVFAVVVAADGLIARRPRAAVLAPLALALWAAGLAGWHFGTIRDLTGERSGLEVIARLERLPRDGKPALLFPWGPRYAAASYARLVTGEYADLRVVDHKADYRALLAEGYQLYSEPETFYTHPPPWPSAYGAPSDWWPEHLDALSLTSAAPGYARLLTAPDLAAPGESPGEPLVYGITRRAAWLTCDAAHLYLHVIWSAERQPEGDPSIFVHLTGDAPAPNPPDADARHPVYGLYPFAQMAPRQLVRDDFTLPRLPDMTQVRFGLYEQTDAGFSNYGETVLPISGCQPVAWARP
ncbi:MAG: DUF2723 domain-containing protein [Anaerolineae bacterium]|nr:DUF2723 domain-containing protein [Anaerolineae bacterium]